MRRIYLAAACLGLLLTPPLPAQEPKLLFTFQDQPQWDSGSVTSIAFSGDCKLLVSNGGWDQKVKVWDVVAGKENLRLDVDS